MVLLLLFGIFCCSTSVIFIKFSETDPVLLAAYRCLLAALFLSPLAWRSWKRHPEWTLPRLFRLALPPATFLGIHFISWILGARLTPAANASLLVNMVPAVMPILLFLYLRERLNTAEIIGTVFAMSGVALLAVVDFNLSPEFFIGDMVCFLSMLFYACYLIYARKHREVPSIYLYVVPIYFLSGLLCLFIGLGRALISPSVAWIGPDLPLELFSILGLALVPTVLGHSIINRGLKMLRGQVVVILNLSQFIFAGIMGYFLLGEVPAVAFFFASFLVVGGAMWIILRSPSTP